MLGLRQGIRPQSRKQPVGRSALFLREQLALEVRELGQDVRIRL